MDSKVCVKCEREFPATPEFFNKNKCRSDGLKELCKECHRAYSRDYYAENREKMLKGKSLYFEANRDRILEWKHKYHEANRDKLKEDCSRYYKAHAEELKEKASQWQKANPEKKREIYRRYRKANPEKMRELKHRRRAHKHNADGIHTAEDIQAQYDRQKGKCFWCKAKVKDDYHVDHVIPLSRGGRDSRENLVISCPHCNISKHNKMPAEFAGILI